MYNSAPAALSGRALWLRRALTHTYKYMYIYIYVFFIFYLLYIFIYKFIYIYIHIYLQPGQVGFGGLVERRDVGHGGDGVAVEPVHVAHGQHSEEVAEGGSVESNRDTVSC